MSSLDAEIYSLTTKALKAIAGSPKQKEIIKKLNVLRKKKGLKPLKENRMSGIIDKLVEQQLIKESWLSNELIPILQGYKNRGAKKQTDYIYMATQDREKDIVDFLVDMSPAEWKSMQRTYLREDINESSRTLEITDPRDIDRKSYYTIWELIRGTGRYVVHRTYYGDYFIQGSEGSFYIESPKYSVYPKGINPNDTLESTKGFNKNLFYNKGCSFICPFCGLNMPKYEGRYPSKCPSCKTAFEKKSGDKKSDETKYLGSVSYSSAQYSENISVLGILDNMCYLKIMEGKFAYTWEGHTAEEIEEKVDSLLEDNSAGLITFILKDLTLVEDGIKKAFDTIPEDIEGIVTRKRILEGDEETSKKALEKFWSSSKGKSILKEKQKIMEDMKEEEIELELMKIVQVPLLEMNSRGLLEKLITMYSVEGSLTSSYMLESSADEDTVNDFLASMTGTYSSSFVERDKNKNYMLIIY